jgi:hypothetical protein
MQRHKSLIQTMNPRRSTRTWLRIAGFLLASTVCAMSALAEAALMDSDPAASLRERYAALSERLEQSPLQPGLYLESVESSRALRGDIYAVVDYPFATASAALTGPQNWCEALILHLNVKYCRASTAGERTVLAVAVGKKIDQPLSETYRFEFAYNLMSLQAGYQKVDLGARRGPLGTRNNHIVLEMIELEGEQTLLHIQYAYTYGLTARIAMRAYLATSGHGKVGFTKVGSENDEPPHYVGGVRGALERNVMRYYLAIEAHLGALAAQAPQGFEDSLERWFAATERYALQLHEVDHDAYIAMKRREYLRQQTAP